MMRRTHVPRPGSGAHVRPLAAAALAVFGATAAVTGWAQATLRPATRAEREAYAFLPPGSSVRSLRDTFPAPAGFERMALPDGSFGGWLRGLPLKEPSPVRSHAGDVILERDDPGLAAVVAIDVGRRDLQQCADSILRLHAEWLWSSGRRDEIAWHFTSGDLATWTAWASGQRPVVRGSKVAWAASAPPDDSRRSFRAYLDTVFTYAGTLSLAAHATPVDRDAIAPGDVLVQGGTPGHAVIVLDVATDASGRRVALLGQGYMPAQDFHVLAVPDPGARDSAQGDPWWPIEGEFVKTPYWPRPFAWADARRLAPPRAK